MLAGTRLKTFFSKIKFFFVAPPTRVWSILLWTVASIFITYHYLGLYIKGDLIFYRMFYMGIAELDLPGAYDFYKGTLVSREPVFFLLSYIGSNLVSHDILMLVLNTLFGFLLGCWLFRMCAPCLTQLLLVGNFYFLVLLLPAERLKLAIIILLGAGLLSAFKRYLFFVFALTTHIQTVLLAPIFLPIRKIHNLKLNLYRFNLTRILIISIILCLVIYLLNFLLKDHILIKYDYYHQRSPGVISIFKPILFTFITLYYSKNKQYSEVVLLNSPLILASYLVGSDRIVLFSYFIFMYYCLINKLSLRTGVFLINIYFFYKGLIFLNKISINGHGF